MATDNQLNQKWEAILRNHGLSRKQLKERSVQPIPGSPNQDTSIQACAFDKGLQPWEALVPNVLAEEELSGFHEVPTRQYIRDTPEWAFSNTQVQQVILAFYPLCSENERQHKRAAKMCALLYRYFRLCEPAKEIAVDFGVAEQTIKNKLKQIRKRAAQLGL